jgi:hypothetical protein
MYDDEELAPIKSNNNSDPHARCRDRGGQEGLGTGGDAAEDEMRTCHECLKPWPTWPENKEYVCDNCRWIEVALRDGVDSALCRGPSTKAGRTDNSSPKVGDAGGKHIRGSDGNWVKVSSGFVIPGVVTTDQKVTDYFHDTPSPDQLRARAQRLIDQRKAAQAAADAHQVKAYQALRATGERGILVQARAWEATQIEAQRLFKQAEEEQGLRDAIDEVTDQAQAEHQRRQPPTPGGKEDIKRTQVPHGRVRGEVTLGSLGTILRDATHVKACSPWRRCGIMEGRSTVRGAIPAKGHQAGKDDTTRGSMHTQGTWRP